MCSWLAHDKWFRLWSSSSGLTIIIPYREGMWVMWVTCPSSSRSQQQSLSLKALTSQEYGILWNNNQYGILGTGFPGGSDSLQCGRPGFNPWVRKIPWRRMWQPTPVFLTWRIPWTEEPGGLQSMGSQKVGYDWATKRNRRISAEVSYLICIWKRSLWLSCGEWFVRGNSKRKRMS